MHVDLARVMRVGGGGGFAEVDVASVALVASVNLKGYGAVVAVLALPAR